MVDIIEEKVISVERLTLDWRELSNGVKNSQKFKFEKFEAAFNDTYELLTKSAEAGALDRKTAALVSEAFLFANSEGDSVESICLAAFVLTERMLNYCAFSNKAASGDSASVYIIEARREIDLDFKNPGESVGKLKEIFERQLLPKY